MKRLRFLIRIILAIRNSHRFRKYSKQIVVTFRSTRLFFSSSSFLSFSSSLDSFQFDSSRARIEFPVWPRCDEATSSTIRDEKSFRVAWSLFPATNNKGEALLSRPGEEIDFRFILPSREKRYVSVFVTNHPFPSPVTILPPYAIFTLFYRYYPRIGETEKRFSRFSPRRLLSNASLTHPAMDSQLRFPYVWRGNDTDER